MHCRSCRRLRTLVYQARRYRSLRQLLQGWVFFEQTNKTPERVSDQGFWNLILTMTYSHMGKPHTTIGDASFHY